MKFISTRSPSITASFHDAILQGLAPDGGLYVPAEFKNLSPQAIAHAENDSLTELALRIMTEFITEIPISALQEIIDKALSFPIPLVQLEQNIYLLEVFHGPTLAFKDVGARFMANALSYFLSNQNKKLRIVVATSGDTGSAIASAFHNTPHIEVYILYPSQKITQLQEQQITTFGGNIHALEVQGTFDDCQRLVKTALMDQALRADALLTTANSINIARLLPQIIYHSYSVCQLRKLHPTTNPVLAVPSGNFGNLTSAIYAKRIGFPIEHFVAATNINNIVPEYLMTGKFNPKPSKQSYSNAMDVGNPSNFERLEAFYQHDWQKMAEQITGISISDSDTLQEIKSTYEKTGYILDPHTAVGVASVRRALNYPKTPFIVTATAHPAKFPEVILKAIGIEADMPKSLKAMLTAKKQATLIPADYAALKNVIAQK